MRTRISIKNKSYDIEISKVKENLFKVKVKNKDYFFTQDKSGELIFLEKRGYPSLDAQERIEIVPNLPQQREIKTPIAGIVSKIHIKEGDTIKAGQTIITLAAMKMENEIISESYGKVKKIRVKKNQFVNTEEILITLE